jgi:hypothetical protein
MADSTCVQDIQEDLTDDQIQQLLLEAETRLRGPNTLSTQTDDLASIRYGHILKIQKLGFRTNLH